MSDFARREPYRSPPFSHISPPTNLICVVLYESSTSYIIIPLQQKWGKTEQYLARYPILAHFPYKKVSKRGAKKVENQPSLNTLFNSEDDLAS